MFANALMGKGEKMIDKWKDFADKHLSLNQISGLSCYTHCKVQLVFLLFLLSHSRNKNNSNQQKKTPVY
jgi:hypothetical protein